MKHAKTMLAISMLFSITCLQAVSPGTIAKLEKERKEEESKQAMPQLLAQLPPDLRREILKINAQSEVLNIPAIAKGLTTLAATSKDLHAAINNPGNMLIILQSLPKAGAVVLAKGLQNMPGIKSKEVQDWLNSFRLEDVETLWRAAVPVDPDGITHMPPDIAQIKSLLANPNINVNLREKYGKKRTILIAASFFGHAEVMRLLLNAGANVDLQDRYGNTALMLAAENDRTDIVKILLDAGANINLHDQNGRTALELARRFLSYKTTKLLEDAEKAQKEKSAQK